MNCFNFRIQISALLDDGLEAREVTELQDHFARCPSCAGFYEEQQQLAELFKEGAFDLEPPREIWNRIESRIGSGSERRRFELNRLLPLFRPADLRYAAAGLVVLILCSLALIHFGSGPSLRPLLLAELKSYDLKVVGNPFIPRMGTENPFLAFDRDPDRNPFGEPGSLP